MDNDFFRLSTGDDGIAELQLARPDRMNTLGPAFFTALRDAVVGLDEAGRTRVLVISSTGRHFSAGMALEVFASELALLDTSSARRRLAFQDGLRKLMRCLDMLEEASFPVICAVQGGCIGGALDLAAACDIRVACADAFFTVQEIHISRSSDSVEASYSQDANGRWAQTSPQAQAVLSTTLTSQVTGYLNLSSTRVFSSADNPLSAYGLDTPAYQIDISGGDQRHILAIGNETSTKDGYYVQPLGDPRVFVVSKGAIDNMINLIDNPPLPPTP